MWSSAYTPTSTSARSGRLDRARRLLGTEGPDRHGPSLDSRVVRPPLRANHPAPPPPPPRAPRRLPRPAPPPPGAAPSPPPAAVGATGRLLPAVRPAAAPGGHQAGRSVLDGARGPHHRLHPDVWNLVAGLSAV